MADVAARREARRRKILENSHNRLQIIAGKNSDEFPRESPIKTLIPEPEYNFPATVSTSSFGSTSHQNGLIVSPPSELLEFLSATHGIDASGDGEVFSDLATLLPPPAAVPPISEPAEIPMLSLWEKITSYKYDIVLLSLLLQILYSLSLMSFDSGYFFFPVIVYIVTKLIWFPTHSSSNIANMLLLLNGMSQARVQKILYFSQCLGVISHDIFVYLFTTICIQSLWITFRDNLVA